MRLQTGIFSDLIEAERVRPVERRSSLENPQTPLSFPAEWLLDVFNGGRTDSGIRVSELTAFQTIAFLACVDIIAGKISSLPFHVYERSISSKVGRAIHKIAYDHDYYDLIYLEPNDEMSRQTFIKAFLLHALAWPGAYAEIQRNGGNGVEALWPRNPDHTRPRRLSQNVTLEPEPWRPFPRHLTAGTLIYETTDGMDLAEGNWGGARIIAKEDMLHVPSAISFDGRIGQGVVWLARQALGLALATEKFGAKYFANFAKPGGILEVPTMKPDDREKAKQSWLEAQGGENSHRVAVVTPGVKWTPMSHNPEEAQTIETRSYIDRMIAAVFHVPGRMVGDNSKTSRASTEQENQELLDFALAPWIGAIKLEFKRKLFPHSGLGRRPKNPYYVDFDTWEVVRGDAQSREKFYAGGRQWGYLCANDVRAFEKLNPIEEDWAEENWMPVNMTLTTTPVNPAHQDGKGAGAVPIEDVKETENAA
jgi:HK97 family phage portal protein